MAHQRQLIREAAKTALVGISPYNTAAQTRVYETRVVPWRRLELPAIAVYALDESISVNGSAPREFTRTLQLEVVGAVEAVSNVDDSLDSLAAQIETAMQADETLAGTCGDCILTATEIAVDADAQKPIGFIRMVYEVTYYTYATPGDSDLEIFERANVRFKLENEIHEDNEAVDALEDINEEEDP